MTETYVKGMSDEIKLNKILNTDVGIEKKLEHNDFNPYGSNKKL